MEKLVSVVIPAFNAEPYIERTIQSIINQTYGHLQIIVIDDGSTDRTAQIVDRIRLVDSRVKLYTKKNGGVARARNAGIDHACGEFIAFVDADDLWHPEKIQLQVDALEDAGSDFAASYALYRSIDLEDRVLFNGQDMIASGYIYSRHLCFGFISNGSSLLVRRSAVQSIGGYEPLYADRGIGGCEDLDFELRLAARFKICGVPHYLIGYRRYEGNMSSNRLRMSRSIIATVRRNMAAGPILPLRAKRYALGSVFDYVTWLMLRDKRPHRALATFICLAIVDFRRSSRLASMLYARVSSYFKSGGQNLTPDEVGKNFLDLPSAANASVVPNWVKIRLADLSAVDESLWTKTDR